MTKTLADMTADERADCVGMWCDVKGFTRPTPIVYIWGEEVELLIYNNLRGHVTETYDFSGVTPRFDLPRAWTPDGEPVPLSEETWEYAVQVKRSESWKYTYESWSTRWQVSYSVQKARAQRDHPGEETRIVRRRVSDVEVVNE